MSNLPPSPEADTPSMPHDDTDALEAAVRSVEKPWTRYAIRCVAGIFPHSEIVVRDGSVMFIEGEFTIEIGDK